MAISVSKKRIKKRKTERERQRQQDQDYLIDLINEGEYRLESGYMGRDIHLFSKSTYIRLRPCVEDLMKRYDLSEAMLHALAGYYGREPIADGRSTPALIRRKLVKSEPSQYSGDSVLRLTNKGFKVCAAAFTVIIGE